MSLRTIQLGIMTWRLMHNYPFDNCSPGNVVRNLIILRLLDKESWNRRLTPHAFVHLIHCIFQILSFRRFHCSPNENFAQLCVLCDVYTCCCKTIMDRNNFVISKCHLIENREDLRYEFNYYAPKHTCSVTAEIRPLIIWHNCNRIIIIPGPGKILPTLLIIHLILLMLTEKIVGNLFT